MIPLSAVGQLPQGAGDLEKSVERKVEVTENKTIFTLFCLLNLGGYDEENNPDGLHPVPSVCGSNSRAGCHRNLLNAFATFTGSTAARSCPTTAS